MWIYAALLLLPLAWSLPRFRGPSALGPAALIALLSIVIGLRREVGGDWDSYLLIFHRAHSYPLATALALSDPAYVLAARALAAIGLGVAALNLVCAALFSAGLVLFCASRPRPWLALLIATPILIVIVAMGYTRQSAALGLVMIALSLWSRRPLLAAVLIVLAPAWHWSAVVLLPLIGFLALRRPLRLWLTIPAALAGAIVLLVIIRIPAAAVYAENTRHSGGALLRLVPNVGALVLLAALWRRISLTTPERNALWYWFAVSLLLLAFAAILPTLADRLGVYAILGQIAVLTRLPDLLPQARWRGAAAVLIAMPYVVLLAGWLAFSPYRACWAPYRSYLSAPSEMLFARHDAQIRRNRDCERVQFPELEQIR